MTTKIALRVAMLAILAGIGAVGSTNEQPNGANASITSHPPMPLMAQASGCTTGGGTE